MVTEIIQLTILEKDSRENVSNTCSYKFFFTNTATTNLDGTQNQCMTQEHGGWEGG